ncbi:hypothetical protein L7F22_041866 [Adiantum nelumboides]|nr:hypothetical protein [Adiantum nelumboides]
MERAEGGTIDNGMNAVAEQRVATVESAKGGTTANGMNVVAEQSVATVESFEGGTAEKNVEKGEDQEKESDLNEEKEAWDEVILPIMLKSARDNGESCRELAVRALSFAVNRLVTFPVMEDSEEVRLLLLQLMKSLVHLCSLEMLLAKLECISQVLIVALADPFHEIKKEVSAIITLIVERSHEMAPQISENLLKASVPNLKHPHSKVKEGLPAGANGTPWFDRLAASIKFLERKISFKFKKKDMYMNAQESGSTIFFVNDQAFDKSIMSSIPVYMIFVKDSLSDDNKTQVNESGMHENLELFKFLYQFQDVFIEDILGELPPKRGDDDHAIELLLGSSPPIKPPYRVSQVQQEEIMRQVNELVEKGMVRIATLHGINAIMRSKVPANVVLTLLVPAAQDLVFDQTEKVRKFFFHSVAEWLGYEFEGSRFIEDKSRLLNCNDWVPKLLPLLLYGISDQSAEVGTTALLLVEGIGKLYAAYSTSIKNIMTICDSQDERAYKSNGRSHCAGDVEMEYQLLLPAPFKGRPGEGCCMLVQAFLKELIGPIKDNLQEWSEITRCGAARLLLALLVYSYYTTKFSTSAVYSKHTYRFSMKTRQAKDVPSEYEESEEGTHNSDNFESSEYELTSARASSADKESIDESPESRSDVADTTVTALVPRPSDEISQSHIQVGFHLNSPKYTLVDVFSNQELSHLGLQVFAQADLSAGNVMAEQRAGAYLHLIVPALSSAVGDDNLCIAKLLVESAHILGWHTSPHAWLPLVLGQVASSAANSAQVTNKLVVLSGLLYGTQKQAADKDLAKEVIRLFERKIL